MSDKKRIFSGIKPSGRLNIGGYIGALSQWIENQKDYDCIFCVADYHAITVKQNPEDLRSRTIELIKTYLAAGIDPKKCLLFKQSDVPAHTELAWILNCCGARIADLNKMTQFKDKAKLNKSSSIKNIYKTLDNTVDKAVNNISSTVDSLKELITSSGGNFKKMEDGVLKLIDLLKDNTNSLFMVKSLNIDISVLSKNEDKLKNVTVGLYDYPVLMAADILLYNTEIVPVGEDQKQHVELTRDIARRFNKDYAEIFKIPEAAVRKEGARVMSLQDPTKKMSKSDENGLGCIELLDDIEVAKKKIMRAVTDSGSEIKYDLENKPAISNLLTIYSYLSSKSVQEIEREYVGLGYGDFKKGLAEIVAKFLSDFQNKYNAISDQEVFLILEEGRVKAEKIANETLTKARQAVGVR